VDAAKLETYAGRWVALGPDGGVVASADELDELLVRLGRNEVRASTMRRIPSLDDPLFVGLS
jgi:hypothetical protein